MKKLYNFLKGWSSVLLIDPNAKSVRSKIDAIRNRNTSKIDSLNIKKDFTKAMKKMSATHLRIHLLYPRIKLIQYKDYVFSPGYTFKAEIPIELQLSQSWGESWTFKIAFIFGVQIVRQWSY